MPGTRKRLKEDWVSCLRTMVMWLLSRVRSSSRPVSRHSVVIGRHLLRIWQVRWPLCRSPSMLVHSWRDMGSVSMRLLQVVSDLSLLSLAGKHTEFGGIVYPSELAQALINSPTPATENFEDQRFIPARRFGTEEEIARAILYLASRWGALL